SKRCGLVDSGRSTSGQTRGVELTLPDGSTMVLNYAFFVHDEAQGAVGIFTEHCGYHCFAAIDLEVREIRDGAIVGRHRWGSCNCSSTTFRATALGSDRTLRNANRPTKPEARWRCTSGTTST